MSLHVADHDSDRWFLRPALVAVAGIATFAGCKIDKSGTGYTLTATANLKSGSRSALIQIGPALGEIDVTVLYVPQPVISSISSRCSRATSMSVSIWARDSSGLGLLGTAPNTYDAFAAFDFTLTPTCPSLITTSLPASTASIGSVKSAPTTRVPAAAASARKQMSPVPQQRSSHRPAFRLPSAAIATV